MNVVAALRRRFPVRAHRDMTVVRFDRQARRLHDLERTTQELTRRLDKCQGTVNDWTPMMGNARTLLHVIEHQVGALEVRLADLADLITPAKPMDDVQRTEAIDVLAEVRAEHRRVRTQLKIIGSYEERIRRLEAVARVTLDTAPFTMDVHGRRTDV